MVLLENYEGHTQNWQQCFNDPKRSDVVFEAKDGQTFHCQKFVLEVASPYLKKLFGGKCGGPTKYVEAKDVDPAALKWILRACYTGDGEVDDDNVVSVMVAAGMYEMEWVEKACMKYLKKGAEGPLATFKYSKENQKWQEWKVPESGWYHLVAMGAKAADQAKLGQVTWSKGGEGAMIGGSFQLQAGDVIQILTGGMSTLLVGGKYKNLYSGGGGGTFVALGKKELSLLLTAGGGGSIVLNHYGGDGSLDKSGTSANAKCVGGKNGDNGTANGAGIGGLGWKAGPIALAKPRLGGDSDNGGFGGGGNLWGGGGGYSGGSAGCNNGAGGGGSYIAPQAENGWKKVGSLGHGKVFVWKGKNVPLKETLFLEEVGVVNIGAQSNEESIDSWEMME
ncbi:hypothetical protein BSKO_02932 [Bryopsis sp. KO-2023]|nr:hypothetical protein BSKO_02932 [Bryopsis sp. KO-2023]